MKMDPGTLTRITEVPLVLWHDKLEMTKFVYLLVIIKQFSISSQSNVQGMRKRRAAPGKFARFTDKCSNDREWCFRRQVDSWIAIQSASYVLQNPQRYLLHNKQQTL